MIFQKVVRRKEGTCTHSLDFLQLSFISLGLISIE
jgi:hypothetical protein